MAVNAFEQLLFDFQEAEAKWWVKSLLSFKIWARPRFTNKPGWLPQSPSEIHVGTFRLGSCLVDQVNPEKGQHPQDVSCEIVTHCGLVLDDDKRVKHFIRLATKAGAHLCPEIQVHVSPDPDGPLNRWLALMWRLYPAVDVGAKIAGDPEYRFATHQFLDSPFRDSANAIERCGLHTDHPEWPFTGGYGPTREERFWLRQPTLVDSDLAEEELDRLNREVSDIDYGSEDWRMSKNVAAMLGLATKTLANRRSAGEKRGDKNKKHGLHDKYLFWRKSGNDDPVYYLPMITKHVGHLAKTFPMHRLELPQNLPDCTT